jgi:hypothetical protein
LRIVKQKKAKVRKKNAFSLPLLLILLFFSPPLPLLSLSLSPFVSYYYSQLSTGGSVVSTCAFFTCVYLFLTIYPL